MVIEQGDVWWADLGEPRGSETAYRRPVLIIQSDAFNRSRLATVLAVPLTGSLRRADTPGNVYLAAADTGLERDSVANVALTLAVNKSSLDERVGPLSRRALDRVLRGLDLVLGR